jgi:camphor resistance protein CrcB
MRSFFFVFAGAGLGGALRHAVNLGVARLVPSGLGMSTLIVNVVGCFLMGIVVEAIALKAGAANGWRLFLTTGVLGGFTTFSAFSLETAMLYERGQVGWAALNVLGSVTLSIAALFAGLYLVRHAA